ncbi:MAG: sensor histidine kinase [Acidobacteriota bacterium]
MKQISGHTVWLRVILIGGFVLAVSSAHYMTPPAHFFWHNVFQRLYYIPLLLACSWFGVRGGLLTALACAALYAPHILLQWASSRAYQVNQVMELVMIGLMGVVAGVLSDRQRSQRIHVEKVAAERDLALHDLQETVETLRQADRLATLGTLAAGLAHEVRNPLAAMSGAVEILGKEFPAEHPQHEFMEILEQEIGRLNQVVGKYLDYARPQALEPRPLDVQESVRSAVALLQRSADRSAVRFQCHLPAGLPPALADPVQLHQALVNLLLNGIQAMPSGGLLEVNLGMAPNGIQVEVRDHGDGLPGGARERLFEPFFSTKPGGTGLGLAVASQIASSHGGSLTAEDVREGGALFRLVLPAAPGGERQ